MTFVAVDVCLWMCAFLPYKEGVWMYTHTHILQQIALDMLLEHPSSYFEV